MDGLNRVLLTIAALLVGSAGLSALLVGIGVLPAIPPDTPVLPPWVLDRVSSWGRPGIAEAGGAGVILAWLGWVLLRAELRPRGRAVMPYLTGMPPAPQEGRGSIRVRGRALRDSAERALRRVPGIERARVALSGSRTTLTLRARLDVDVDAPLEAVRDGVHTVLARLATTVGVPLQAQDLEMRVMNGARRITGGGARSGK